MASSISSGSLTANTLLFDGRNRLNAITVLGDGTNAVTVTVYDNNTNAGQIIAKVILKAGNTLEHVLFENPVKAELGLYVVIAGVGAEVFVFYGG